MKRVDLDIDHPDFADQIIRTIEDEYGRSVVRIPHFKQVDFNSFDIKLIFSDFRLLEAKIKVVPFYDMPSIQIQGTFY